MILTVGLLSTVNAALGLLATALFRLDGKIDTLDARLNGRLDSVGGRLDGLVAEMHAGFTGLHQDVSALDRRLAKVER
jgi:hypothetical protein